MLFEAAMQEAGPHNSNSLSADAPRSFWQCFPWIWTNILFPGSNVSYEPLRWRTLLILLTLPALFLYPCMSFFLFEPDEGRYAEIPREMLAASEWIVPLLHGEPYLDKPPLLYWLIMGCYGVFGVHDWAARLVPALAVHGSILLVYLLGRRSLGERPAFWGALLLTLAPGFEGMGRLLLLDGLLTFLTTLALFCVLEAVRGERLRWSWWIVAAVTCGLGVLTKGPVILILVLPPLLLHGALTGKPARISWRAAAAFFGVTALVSLPWYFAICVRLPEFTYHFLWTHNVMRFFQPFDHIRPMWFYLPILLLCMTPATFLLWPFLRFLFTGNPETARLRTPALGFFFLSGGWCVLFFSLSGSKLPTYVLPAFPPLLLALGTFVAASRWRTSRWTTTIATVFYLSIVAGNMWLVPWYAKSRSPFNNPQQVRAYCEEPRQPVVCFPRKVHSVAFYLRRNDFRSFRSKYTPQLVEHLKTQPRTVVLFAHRHSPDLLKNALPVNLRMTGRAPLGLCEMAIVEKKKIAPANTRY